MANKLYEESDIQAIANAIRAKGQTGTMKVSQMAGKVSAISTKEDVEWHQCPDDPKEFVSDVQTHNAYTSANRDSVTYIDKYILSDPTVQEVEANTKPIPKVIDGVSFYDNEPMKSAPFATTNKAGTLTFLDKLRWYRTTRANGTHYSLGTNCRDLGGWACDGGTVKYGWLIRSGELNPVDKEFMVNKIGVKTEVCFLPVNMQQFPNNSPWGIDRAINWTNDDFGYHITNTSPTIIEQWKLYLPTIVRSVIRSKPVVFHCGAGADKTGTMALMLLGILGVSEQDIDIDYELTAFCYGIHAFPRTRKLAAYVNYKNALSVFGGATNLNDGCINFALSLGLTAAELNAFRSACIDGTPTPIIVYHTVTNNLTNCTNSNTESTVSDGESYTTTISPNSGYEMASISVTMGGVDVTSEYVTGYNISIPSVSGDIIITARATAHEATNLLAGGDGVGYFNNTRVSLSSSNLWKRVSNNPGQCATCAIKTSEGDIIRIKGFTYATLNHGICAFFVDGTGTPSAQSGLNNMVAGNTYSNAYASITISDDDIMEITMQFHATTGLDNMWIVVSGVCADGANAFATKNEPLPTTGNILDEVGYFNNTRISLSSTALWKRVSETGHCATGPIHIVDGDIIRIKGFTYSGGYNGIIGFFTDSAGTPTIQRGISGMVPGGSYSSNIARIEISNDNIMTITADFEPGITEMWIDVSGVCADGANAFVTKNEPLPITGNLAYPGRGDWYVGKRQSNSAHGLIDASTEQTTNTFRVQIGDTVRIKGLTGTGALDVCLLYPSSGASTGALSGAVATTSWSYDSASGVWSYTCLMDGAANYPYMRITFFTDKLVGTVNDIIITVNEPIA